MALRAAQFSCILRGSLRIQGLGMVIRTFCRIGHPTCRVSWQRQISSEAGPCLHRGLYSLKQEGPQSLNAETKELRSRSFCPETFHLSEGSKTCVLKKSSMRFKAAMGLGLQDLRLLTFRLWHTCAARPSTKQKRACSMTTPEFRV